MPLIWERAFGGEGYAQNPVGKGAAPVSTPHGEFQFLPNVEDPDCGNVYRNLKFPQSVYEHIQDYQEEKVNAQEPAPMANASQ